MQGRRPTSLTVIQGGIVDAVPPPQGLPDNQVDDWNTFTAELASRGLLDDSTLRVVEAYCSVLANIRLNRDTIQIEGAFIKSKDGIPRNHPAQANLLKAQELANRYAAELGLTPSSRSRRGLGGESPRKSGGGIDDFL